MRESRETLVEAALRVLNTADPKEKARIGEQVAAQWLQGLFITQPYHVTEDVIVPDRPARPTDVFFLFIILYSFQLFDEMTDCLRCSQSCYVYGDNVQVKLVSPSLMPKLGKAGSLQSRQAIVHSLVHTESWAIDLSWVHFFSSFQTAHIEELPHPQFMLVLLFVIFIFSVIIFSPLLVS